jgi:alpha-L-fucosidase
MAGLTLWSLGACGAGVDGAGQSGAYPMSKDYTPPTDPLVLAKLAQWQDLKFGLFMHWGTYSQWGIVESWTLCPEKHPWNRRTGPFADDDRAYKNSYEQLIQTFNPTNFDPAKWAAAAKEAGMRYVVFTTKHHDGFCMFNTAQTDYRITGPACPFRTNPRANVTKDVFSAFRRQGFATGAYFSKADWHCPYYWSPDFPLRDRNNNYDTAQHPELWSKFKAFTWRQIEELMTGYGPVDILWLDGGQVRPPKQDIDMDGLAAMARKHQPGLLVVDRGVRGPNENYRTPENEVPGKLLPYPWETCMTMAGSWSYKPNDNYKSTRVLIGHLCRIVARGGNLLLNIGPDAMGDFDSVAYQRLKEIGAWMKVNGEAIYETRPVAPHERGDWAFTGKRDGTVYAILLAPNDQSVLPETVQLPVELTAQAGQVSLLGFGALQPGATQAGQTLIPIPATARAKPPCAHAWVFKLVPRR